jgi:RNA polymerase sigma-70 factor (ECF subfamily)
MSELSKLTDEEVVEFTRTKNKEAYAEIIRRFQDKLMRYAKYILNDDEKAADVVQESFIKAYVNLNSFNSKRKFSSWIYRIVHNQAINLIVKYKKELPLLDDVDFDSGVNIEEEYTKKEVTKMVKECLGEMPTLYKEPLSLYFLEDKSYNEISDILRIPKNMSKKNKLNFEANIISQIKAGKIEMKPKWYFIAGSVVMFSGFVGLSMGVIFLMNLSIFLIRRNGPLTVWRLQMILSTFPWWIPTVALFGIILAMWLLKKYDFSYKRNFRLLIITFVISVLFAGLLLDKLGLNEYLSRGRMRRFYQNVEMREGKEGFVRGVNQYNRQLDKKINYLQ